MKGAGGEKIKKLATKDVKRKRENELKRGRIAGKKGQEVRK